VINLISSTPEYRHAVVCLSEAGAWRERLPATVEVIALAKRDGPALLMPFRLARLFTGLRPDVIHSRNWAAFDAIAAARLARVRHVVHGEHGREAMDPRGENRRRNRLRRLLHPMVNRFVAVTEDLGRWLVQTVGVPARKVTVIPNGVDTARFAGEGRLAARRSLALADDAFVVGSVGRLDPVKDYASLLRAFAILVRQQPASRLVLAGDGPERGRIEAHLAEASLGDRVLLLGERHDIPLVLAALDVFVLPSIAEGMSNVILEAMASGVPVVATSVGGNPELVDDGATGRLVPPRAPEALAQALAGYAADPHLARLHGKAGRERAVNRFSLERMVEAYQGLYEGLLATGAPDPRHPVTT
jgi:sugar transferase (PEP-CTERM/EpsH1 system associated)